MRKDALGFFWRDEPVVKVVKEKVKVTPPEPTWLKPDYLPNLAEAEVMAGLDLVENPFDMMPYIQQELKMDIECYPNYFLIGFKHHESGKVTYLETLDFFDDEQLRQLDWLLHNFTIVGFNSSKYDVPMAALALSGVDCETLQQASDALIGDGMRDKDFYKQYGIKAPKINHIDLIEVAPLQANLKIYGARAHVEQLQDLPFAPGKRLTMDQIVITRYYCLAKDLSSTCKLREILTEQIDLRVEMSKRYGLDLRSLSDAQIAERVIGSELRKMGVNPERPYILPGTVYSYQAPDYLQFETPYMKSVLDIVTSQPYVVTEDGSIANPAGLKGLDIEIGNSVYRMGIGGLHSTEKGVTHIAKDGYTLHDFDVTSFYPMVILNLKLFPRHLGPTFLFVLDQIVKERVEAKRAGLASVSDSLKIVVNGTYGKLGSKWSIVYSPDLMVAVTLTGQLSLLFLIEMLERRGIQVVSANTDGIVVKCHESQDALMRECVAYWERVSNLKMEESRYYGLFSKDVNNYFAVYDDMETFKYKGTYANPWSSNKNKAMWLHKNPTRTICMDAIQQFVVKGTPIDHTIRSCQDITKFVSVRTVKGGGVSVGDGENEYLGKSVRWYYSTEMKGYFVYAKSGNKVPVTDGARPCLDLPAELPHDIDYEWYIEEAHAMLAATGFGGV